MQVIPRSSWDFHFRVSHLKTLTFPFQFREEDVRISCFISFETNAKVLLMDSGIKFAKSFLRQSLVRVFLFRTVYIK